MTIQNTEQTESREAVRVVAVTRSAEPAADSLDDLFETVHYTGDVRNWRDVPETGDDPDE